MILAASIVASLLLTDSRNAWGGLLLAIPFVLGPARWIWLVPFLTLLLVPVALAVIPGVDFEIQQLSRKLVPKKVATKIILQLN